jgi:TonB family protein
MPFLRFALSCGLSVAVATAVSGASARQPSELDRLLSTDPAPGVEALLLAHATDGRVVRRWRGLLTHGDRRVRLSAARALGATRVRSSAPDLLLALSKEQDVEVVAELLQSIAIVAPDADVRQVYPHLGRIPFDRAEALVDGLAAARPALVARHLTTERPLQFESEWVRVAYARIAGSAPAEVDRVDATLDFTGEETLTAGVVRGAAAARRPLPMSIVLSGLRRGAADRLSTLAYLAAVHRSPAGIPADAALRDAARAGARPSADDDPAARFVDALVARWLGMDAPADLQPMIAALPDVVWIRSASRQTLAVLTEAERLAFVRRFQLPAAAASRVIQARFEDSAAATEASAAPPEAVTMLTDLPPAMLEDVIRITRCAPQAGDERFIAVRYHPDRRPAALGLGAAPFSPGCDLAARAVAAMTYGTPPSTPESRVSALLRLDPEFVSCLTDIAPTTAAAAGLEAAGLRPPVKTRDRTPDYPAVAIRSRLQGIVGVEARIERSGCVSKIRVIRPVQLYLDMASVQAISRWRYTPATLNGVEVPVIMTVDTTFSLK